MMNEIWKKVIVLAVVVTVLINPQKVNAQDYVQGLMEELELDEVDASIQDEEIPDKLRFYDLAKAFATDGTDGVDASMVCEYVFDLFFYEITVVKPIFFQIMVISLLFALFGKLLVMQQGYVSDMGFFMVYTAIVLLLLQSFTVIGQLMEEGIDKMVSFMTAFIPTYAATLMLSGNATSAGFFYEVAFGMIYLLELGMKFVLIPGVHVYVLLIMMDHLFKETRFQKLAELIGSIVRGVLKFGLAAVVGLGVVQSLLTPAKDRLSTSSLYHGIQSIPGVGNTFGATGELLLGCAMMIKNSVGAAALIILFVVCVAPLCSVFCFTVMYRLVAALLEPFCDKRIVECVAGVGRASGIYCKILGDTMLYFLITISMISASTSFIF